MITGVNESQTLTKHISCECTCKFDVKKCNSNKCWNNDDVSVKNIICEKHYVWNPSTQSCKNGKYLASTMDNSAIICDKVIMLFDEEIKTIPTNFNEKKVTCKKQNFYILHGFY